MGRVRVLVTFILILLVSLGSVQSLHRASAQIDVPGCKGTVEQCALEWTQRSAEGIACVPKAGLVACKDAWTARGWAIDNAVKLFGEGPDGDMGNAFQHCAWIGAIATWHGQGIAMTIGENHEEMVPTDELQRQMDLGNNQIGAAIGQTAKDAEMEDMWGYVLHSCEDLAREGQLWGPCGMGLYTPDGYSRPIAVDECPNLGGNMA